MPAPAVAASASGMRFRPDAPATAPKAVKNTVAGTSQDRNATHSQNATRKTIGMRPFLIGAHELDEPLHPEFELRHVLGLPEGEGRWLMAAVVAISNR